VTLEVRVAGKRRIAVDSWGSPTGMPVFLLHGTPGSRSGPRPRSSLLYRLGIRLISYDRPGYGGSDPQPARTVADAASDVEAIADHLELDTFAVVGRSGGGPHALACAALLGARIQAVACLVGLAPSNAKDLDWYAGMTTSNTSEFKARESNGVASRKLKTKLGKQALAIQADPEEMLRILMPELADQDKRIVADIAIQKLLADTYAEAVRKGSTGWIHDVIALRAPWQFDLTSVKAPTLLWHGNDDVFSPVTHTHWLARQIPDSVVAVENGAAHFSAIEILPSALTWIKNPDSSEWLRIEGTHQSALLT
jgi:pimeloyl-ACP methyl ester carboxylesterase